MNNKKELLEGVSGYVDSWCKLFKYENQTIENQRRLHEAFKWVSDKAVECYILDIKDVNKYTRTLADWWGLIYDYVEYKKELSASIVKRNRKSPTNFNKGYTRGYAEAMCDVMKFIDNPNKEFKEYEG